MPFLVTFPAEHHTPDLTVNAVAYSQDFADQIAAHLHIRGEYVISLDTDRGWITRRKTRATSHFTYQES